MPRKSRRGVKRSMNCSWCSKSEIVTGYFFQTKTTRREMCSERCRLEYAKSHEKCSCTLCDNLIRGVSIKVNNNQFCSNLCATQYEKSKRKVPASSQLTYSNFNWADYLRETNTVAAPQNCFKQNSEAMKNQFGLNMHLEALDSRNNANLCLASVKGNIGCRIRIRLEGGDNANDFYQLVDSEQIHPLGYSDKKKILLVPPLGFKYNLNTWHSFLAKLKQNLQPVPESAFYPPPKTPKSNFFKVGQKLEAVDIKHPYLIYPATVSGVKGDKIHVTFDGFTGGFDYWCSYDSRDIFPVGWCQKNEHPLQPPGSFAKPTSVPNNSIYFRNQSNARLTVIDDHTEQPENASTAGAGTSGANPPHITIHVHKNCCENAYVSISSLPDTIREMEPLLLCRNVLEDLLRCSIDISNSADRLKNVIKGEPMTIIYGGTLYQLKAPVFNSDSPELHLKELENFFSSIDTALNTCVPLFRVGEHNSSCVDKCTLKSQLQSRRRTQVTNLRSKSIPELTPQRTLTIEEQSIQYLDQKPVTDWTIEDVVRYISHQHPPLEAYANTFRSHEIDGKALLLINPEIALHYMSLKLGPALKVCGIVNDLNQRRKSKHS